MKIAILGYSGSGKSTLARLLAARFSIPCLHLDAVHWSAGWKERKAQEALSIVSHFLLQNKSLVIDGNYRNLLQQERLDSADLILILQFPRLICLYRAFKRLFRYKGRTRPDMAEGCNEKVDAEFIRWILYKGRSKAVRDHYRRIRQQYPDKVQTLKSSRQIKQYFPCIAGSIS